MQPTSSPPKQPTTGRIAPYLTIWVFIVLYTYLGVLLSRVEDIHHWPVAWALGLATLVLGTGVVQGWFGHRLVAETAPSKIGSATPGFRQFACRVEGSSIKQKPLFPEAHPYATAVASSPIKIPQDCVWYLHTIYEISVNRYVDQQSVTRFSHRGVGFIKKIIHENASEQPVWVADNSGAKLLLHPSFLDCRYFRDDLVRRTTVRKGLIMNRVICEYLSHLTIGDEVLVQGNLSQFVGINSSLAKHLAGPKTDEKTVRQLLPSIKKVVHFNRKIRALGYDNNKRCGLMIRTSKSRYLRTSRFVLAFNLLLAATTAVVAIYSAIG